MSIEKILEKHLISYNLNENKKAIIAKEIKAELFSDEKIDRVAERITLRVYGNSTPKKLVTEILKEELLK